MPVVRGGIQSASLQNRPVKFSDDADQAAEPPQHMEGMRHGQHIEKRVAYIAGKSEPLGPQLHPGQSLASNKQQSKEKGDIKPPRRTGGTTFSLRASHKGCDPAARYFKGNAAGDDDESIQVKHRRQREVPPIRCSTLP